MSIKSLPQCNERSGMHFFQFRLLFSLSPSISDEIGTKWKRRVKKNFSLVRWNLQMTPSLHFAFFFKFQTKKRYPRVGNVFIDGLISKTMEKNDEEMEMLKIGVLFNFFNLSSLPCTCENIGIDQRDL